MSPVVPFSLKDAPALIERLLPVQKLSAEAYKEQMAGSGKTLTALGSYWKGRKPLVLNRACLLGCLLPATNQGARDLEIFERLMAMDDESFVARSKRRPQTKDLLTRVSIPRIRDYFTVTPSEALPISAPVDPSMLDHSTLKVTWRTDVSESERRALEAQALAQVSYRERVNNSWRAEEIGETVSDHIWPDVNDHLGTDAHSIGELVEQLGIMRFGRRPVLADPFCGSGQIAFEAARIGCDVHASDLNPVACMLTWGAFHIAGAQRESRASLAAVQGEMVQRVQAKIDELGVETDGAGWRAKVFLYCVEVRCPQTGWMVPLLPSLVVSTNRSVIAELVARPEQRRYDVEIRTGASPEQMHNADKSGTLARDAKYGDAYLIHRVDGVDYKTKMSTLRGDYAASGGVTANRLRTWTRDDFQPRADDILQERLYCVQWMRPKQNGKGDEYEFRGVNSADLERERRVEAFMAENLSQWRENGWVPDMRIEVGGPPRYQGQDLIRARGWSYWHHVFNPRQLMLGGLARANASAPGCVNLAYSLNYLSKLCVWDKSRDNAQNTFYNQALNTIYNYACRASSAVVDFLAPELESSPIAPDVRMTVATHPATEFEEEADLFITDPPYGDAVKYEEILDFFIAWLRKNPPAEFSQWIWDSRRALAIQGEDETFRRGMVAAFRRMAECMSDNGIQIIMFTHQSGSIWADMANIVWAAGLHVTAAWYVVTETDSALREGSYVKGTVLLVLRKRRGTHKSSRDDLAWEIQEEVESQVAALTGLNQQAKGLYRDENVFEDADIQMAGYAAALRVLTRYAVIDGRDMTAEAIRPRVKGETTFVDGLIAFAVDTANQCLVPQGLAKSHWDRLSGPERFYLKMLDMETRGAKSLDNYQNFAKAFKVRDFRALLASHRANDARLKSAVDFGRAEISEGSELHLSTLRAVLYALMELQRDIDGSAVLAHLTLNVANYYGDMTQRELAGELADYLAKRLEGLRPDEASAARVLRELVKNQRLG